MHKEKSSLKREGQGTWGAVCATSKIAMLNENEAEIEWVPLASGPVEWFTQAGKVWGSCGGLVLGNQRI